MNPSRKTAILVLLLVLVLVVFIFIRRINMTVEEGIGLMAGGYRSYLGRAHWLHEQILTRRRASFARVVVWASAGLPLCFSEAPALGEEGTAEHDCEGVAASRHHTTGHLQKKSIHRTRS